MYLIDKQEVIVVLHVFFLMILTSDNNSSNRRYGYAIIRSSGSFLRDKKGPGCNLPDLFFNEACDPEILAG